MDFESGVDTGVLDASFSRFLDDNRGKSSSEVEDSSVRLRFKSGGCDLSLSAETEAIVLDFVSALTLRNSAILSGQEQFSDGSQVSEAGEYPFHRMK